MKMKKIYINTGLIASLLAVCLFTTSCSSFITNFKEGFKKGLAGSSTVSSTDASAESEEGLSSGSSIAVSKTGDYVKGTLTATALESEYLNLKFTAPEGFVMATEKEIDALVVFAGDIVYEDVGKEKIDYAMAKTVYEMFVQTPSGLPNASICVEKTMSNMTVDVYLDSLKTQLLGIETMEYSFDAETTVQTLAGQDYTVLSATTVYSEVEMIQDYYCRKQGDRIVAIIVTYSTDTQNAMVELLKAFEPLNP
ncbi:MAG: hypothetical protein ACYCYM_06870 [Saccharofermentanales bacterium]